MNNNRLSLDAFKEKANQIETSEVLEKVQGGNLMDCHGFWGRVGKAMKQEISDGIAPR